MFFSSHRPTFKKIRMKRPTVYCLPGFHVDPVWCKSQAEYIEHSLSLTRQYLHGCRVDPSFGVYLSEIDYLKPYLDLFPEERDWITQLIQQERCSTGGSYNQPNETSICGESLIRNLMIGSQYHHTMVGHHPLVYMAWDVFGHIPQLPQILEGCGFAAVVFTRTNYRDPSIPIPGLPNLFQWCAPDGSSIYALRTNYYLDKEVSIEEYAKQELERMKTAYPELNTALIIDAGDMFSPRIHVIGRCKQLAEQNPSLILSGAAAEKFFSSVHYTFSRHTRSLVKTTRDMTQYNEGCELSRIDLKLANRRLENLLFETELWGSIGASYGLPYPSYPIDHAWRQLIFTSHHDGITGCGSDIVVLDLLDCYREALETVADQQRSILQALSTIVTIEAEQGDAPLLVFNSLPWLRDGVVRHWIDIDPENEGFELIDAEGQHLAYEIEQVHTDPETNKNQALALWAQSEIPATGFTQTTFVKPNKKNKLPLLKDSQSQTWIENDLLRVEIDPSRGGGIVSLIEKETGKEFIKQHHPYLANELIALKEGEGDEPAWRLITTGERISASVSHAEVKTVEGPVTKRLMIRGEGPGPCKRIQEIRLYRDLPYLDCFTILENYLGYFANTNKLNARSRRDLYTVVFPLDLPGALPVLEDRFYVKAYRRGRHFMDYRSTMVEWTSQHAMNSCYRWIDASWTLMIRFVDQKEEVSSLAIGPSEIVTNRSCNPDLGHRLMMYLARHGVTCTPRYDTEPLGNDRMYRSCSYAIGAIEENSFSNEVLQKNPAAKEYYERTMNDFGFAVLVLDATPSDSKGPSHPVILLAGKTNALTAQTIEDMIQGTIAHRWECPASACFIDSLEPIEDFGFAIFNQGTTLGGMEPDGALVTALMHTVPYPSPQTSWPFDFAEQKTHVFQYRLYPHRGDWRHAEVPRRAMEYNHEPVTVAVAAHAGHLPNEKTFLSVEPNNMLISCLKPAGFPEAEYQPPGKARPLYIARFYETHGEESNVWIESSKIVKSVKAVTTGEQPPRKKREVFREEQFIRTIAHANEIITLQMEIQHDKSIAPRPEDAEAPRLIVPARYWRYNIGTAPLGFLPLSMSIRGRIREDHFLYEQTLQLLELVLVNNSPHRSCQGEVRLSCPPYWRVLPESVQYQIDAGSYRIVPFHVLFDIPDRPGFIRAETSYNGVTLEDLVHIGASPEYDISMTLKHDSFNIKLRHSLPYDLRGSIRIITPIECWPDRLVGELSLTAYTPRMHQFCIAPDSETVLSFHVTDRPNRYDTPSEYHWMVVKIETHQTIRYYHVRMDGRESLGLGRILSPPYVPQPVEESG